MVKKSVDWSGIIKIGMIGLIAYFGLSTLSKLFTGEGLLGGLMPGIPGVTPPPTGTPMPGIPDLPPDFWQKGGYATETVTKDPLPWWSWISPFAMLGGGYQWLTDPGTRELDIGTRPPPTNGATVYTPRVPTVQTVEPGTPERIIVPPEYGVPTGTVAALMREAAGYSPILKPR